MPLFDIPGWSVKAEPVSEQSSRKRKRNSEDSEKRPEANLDKLVNRLTGGRNNKEKKAKAPKKDKLKEEKSRQSHEDKKKSISLPKPLKGTRDEEENNASTTSVNQPPAKKVKTMHAAEKRAKEPRPSTSTEAGSSASGLTDMQASMRQSLNGARFRMINETLYKTNSSEARAMMQDDQSVFHEYHSGFRYQVQSWPTNPVEKYIDALSSSPPKTVIADLGCGDAALARSLIPKGLVVLSYDLISTNPFVVAADTHENLPLPGSEPKEGELSEGEAQVVNVVVCALSLMGTNWPVSLREAWRVLCSGGALKIAEVASRFVNVKQFISLVSSIGFRLSSKDASNTHFTMFEFRKIARTHKTDAEWATVIEKGNLLKPCEYKRR